MLSAERKLKIAELVIKNGGVRTSELSNIFNVSEMTVLRDFTLLEKQGILKRVYGGAVSVRDSYNEVSSSYREKIHTGEKNLIASKARNLISEGDSIFLDGSTTSLVLAKRLYDAKNLTVVTNGLDVANEIQKNSSIKLICSGGELNNVTMTFLGPGAEEFLKGINVDKTFISSGGISIRAGLTEPNPLQASLKKIMIENSKSAVLIVDSSKFNEIALNKVCPIESLGIIITDKKPKNHYLAFCRKNNVEIIF